MAKETNNSNQGANQASKSPSYKASEKVARRRKAKKIATIVGGVGFAGLAIMTVIAFLGRVSGNFTINVNQQATNARLQLSTSKDFTSETTGVHLKGPGLENAAVTTADYVLSSGDQANSSEEGGSYSSLMDDVKYDEEGNEISRTNKALIYSCFVKNPGQTSVKYDLTLVMTGYTSPSNAAVEPYSLLRVGIWQTRYSISDESEQETLFTAYAAENPTIAYVDDGTGIKKDSREFVGESHKVSGIYEGTDVSYRRLDKTIATDTRAQQLAEPFTGYLGNSGLFSQRYRADSKFNINSLEPGQKARYTFAFWFEGGDPDCQGDTPTGSSMTFQMNFAPSVL